MAAASQKAALKRIRAFLGVHTPMQTLLGARLLHRDLRNACPKCLSLSNMNRTCARGRATIMDLACAVTAVEAM
jgi:hypothetical protein